MLSNWKPKDLITLVILLGCFLLKALGINSTTDIILYATALGHLGLSITTMRKKP